MMSSKYGRASWHAMGPCLALTSRLLPWYVLPREYPGTPPLSSPSSSAHINVQNKQAVSSPPALVHGSDLREEDEVPGSCYGDCGLSGFPAVPKRFRCRREEEGAESHGQGKEQTSCSDLSDITIRHQSYGALIAASFSFSIQQPRQSVSS